MSIFRNSELSKQQEALNDYANSLRNVEQDQAEQEEGIDAFNAKLRTITNPIGGALITQPISKFVKAGVNRAVGYTEDKVRSKLTDLMAKASNGDLSAFGSNLPSNIQRNIQDVLSDEVSPNVRNAFGSLSKKAQDAINRARRRAGKNIIRNTREPTRVSTETQRTTMDNPEEGTPEPTVARELSSAEQAREQALPREPTQAPASEVPADPAVEADTGADDGTVETLNLGDRLDALRDEYNQNLTDTIAKRNYVDTFRDENGELPDEAPMSVSEAQDAIASNVARQGAIQSEIADLEPQYHQGLLNMNRNLAGDISTERIQESGANAPASEEGQQAGASDQPPAQNGDANDDLQNNLDNTDATPISDAPEVGDDVLTGLEDTADTLDAVAGATSEVPVLGEIIAGVAGIASIIAGAEGAKKPAPYSQPITSGIQFGI